ncbi:MAG: hypothetical protein ACI8ZN_002622 [Bacteroidia bacterium]|jgi:hypothetical protein
MRTLFTVLPFLLISQLSLGQITNKQIKFESEDYDFGIVPFKHGMIEAQFVFTNHSEQDFIIRNVEASCGCTVPFWPKKAIKPGEQARITATFDPSNLGGEVDKSIQLYANYQDIMVKNLHIKGIIEVPQSESSTGYPGANGYLRALETTVGLNDIVNTKKYTRTIRWVNEYNLALSIKEVTRVPDYCAVSFSQKLLQPGDTANILVEVDGTKVQDYGVLNSSIQILTNDRFVPYKEIIIAFNIHDDFSALNKRAKRKAPGIVLVPSSVDLGEIKEGAVGKATILIKNTGKSTLIIYKVKADCNCTILKNLGTEIPAGVTKTVEVSLDSIYITGKTTKQITLYTNDPVHPVVSIQLHAKVLEN